VLAPRPCPGHPALIVTMTDGDKERAMTRRIFHALPTQTETTTVAFIYRMCFIFSFFLENERKLYKTPTYFSLNVRCKK
jgi:hypothetical protein